MDKLIIEARVNEFMMRDQGNRHVPYLPAEIASDAVACRDAGAAIVHFHARKADGAPEHEAASYAETVALIRSSSDILVHPTLGYVTHEGGPEERHRRTSRQLTPFSVSWPIPSPAGSFLRVTPWPRGLRSFCKARIRYGFGVRVRPRFLKSNPSTGSSASIVPTATFHASIPGREASPSVWNPGFSRS